MFGKIREIAPKSFNDGLNQCNLLGKKIAKQSKHRNFLDLGCGDGSLTMDFASEMGVKDVYGIEYVDEERKKARQKKIKCVKGDLNDRFKLRSSFFELVLSSQNIEHLHNTRLYLAECYRVLKPGGRIIILTENLSSWINILPLFFGWQPFSTANINGWSIGNPLSYHRDKEKDERFTDKYNNALISGATGHVRVLAYYGLKELLERTGFDEIKMYTRGYLPFWGWLAKLMCSVDKIHGHFLIATAVKPRK